MLARLGNLFLVLALLAATGAHWGVLQSVAWTTMLAGNLSTCSFNVAVQKTFDGRHPCALCKQISAGKKSEQKAEFPAQLQKLEYLNEKSCFVFAAPADFTLLPAQSGSPDSINHTPPSPPPRGFHG